MGPGSEARCRGAAGELRPAGSDPHHARRRGLPYVRPVQRFPRGGDIGAPLARLELQIALPALFEGLPGIFLAEPPRYRDNYHFHGLAALDVGWP